MIMCMMVIIINLVSSFYDDDDMTMIFPYKLDKDSREFCGIVGCNVVEWIDG